MRPLLTLMGAGLYSENVSNALHAAVGLELFHNFTLLHDDIMDNAPLRRGNPTVHAKWNSNIAILSGDALYTEAMRQIGMSPRDVLAQVLDVFTRTALGVCEGQQYDMDFETTAKVSIAEYLKMIELKTAVLLGASLEIGALCGGAGKNEAQKLYEFGRHVGIAFQLQDDILDVYGDENKFGKKSGGDIVANKKTYLLLKAFECANSYQQEELNNWLMVMSKDASEKVAGVKALYDVLGVRKLAEAEMHLHYKAGIDSLQSVRADAKKIAVLKKFTDDLMVREQ